MKRLGGFLLAAIGLVLVIFGVVTALNQSDTETAEVVVSGDDAQFIYTSPGVINLGDDEVAVVVSAPGSQVQWGLGSTADVLAFIGESAAREVTGLSSWDSAATTDHAGTPEAAQATQEVAGPDYLNSDMWLEYGSAQDTIEFEVVADPALAQSLIFFTDAGTAPQVQFTWTVSTAPVSPLPLVVIGTMLMLIGLLLVLIARQDRKAVLARQQAIAERSSRSRMNTEVLPKIKDAADEDSAANADELVGEQEPDSDLSAADSQPDSDADDLDSSGEPEPLDTADQGDGDLESESALPATAAEAGMDEPEPAEEPEPEVEPAPAAPEPVALEPEVEPAPEASEPEVEPAPEVPEPEPEAPELEAPAMESPESVAPAMETPELHQPEPEPLAALADSAPESGAGEASVAEDDQVATRRRRSEDTRFFGSRRRAARLAASEAEQNTELGAVEPVASEPEVSQEAPDLPEPVEAAQPKRGFRWRRSKRNDVPVEPVVEPEPEVVEVEPVDPEIEALRSQLDAGPVESDQEWRNLWNFNWDTRKKDEDNA